MGGIFDKGGGSSQPPTPIDPHAVADEQIRINRQQMLDNARFNRTDQSTPWGSMNWTRDAEGNPISSSISLNPQDQARLDAQRNQMAQRTQQGQQFLNQVDTSPLNWGGLHPMYDRFAQGGPTNYAGAVNAPRPGPDQNYQAINPTQRQDSGNAAQGRGGNPLAAALRGMPGSAQSSQDQGSNPLSGFDIGGIDTMPHGQASQPTGELPMPGDPPREQPSFDLTYQDYLAARTNRDQVDENGVGGKPMSEQDWNAMPPDQRWNEIGGGMAIRNSDPRYAALAAAVGERDPSRSMWAGPSSNWQMDWANDPSQYLQGRNGVNVASSGNESAAHQASQDFGAVQYGWAVPLAAGAIGALGGAAGAAEGAAPAAAPGAASAAPAASGAAAAAPAAASAGGIDPALLQGVSAGAPSTWTAPALAASPTIGAGSGGMAAMLRNPNFLRAAAALLLTPRRSTNAPTNSGRR